MSFENFWGLENLSHLVDCFTKKILARARNLFHQNLQAVIFDYAIDTAEKGNTLERVKNILKKSKSGQDPFIFLNGIGSLELGFILDYIYRGEVQLFQDQIEKFLDSAQILKIDGLNSEENEKADSKESWHDASNDVEDIDINDIEF